MRDRAERIETNVRTARLNGVAFKLTHFVTVNVISYDNYHEHSKDVHVDVPEVAINCVEVVDGFVVAFYYVPHF